MKSVYPFLPSYRPEEFKDIGEPSKVRNPFRVFFAGRIERNKGVFHLLEIAKREPQQGPVPMCHRQVSLEA
jgi:glycosyltransferase involved in cell wall biosynthesis